MIDHEDEKMGTLIHMFEQGPDLPGVKVCSRCGDEKPATREFFHANGKGRLRPKCKDCSTKTGRRHVDQRPIEERLTDTHKLCADCMEKKLKAEFSPFKRNKDGLKSYCDDCCRKRANREIKKRIRKDWRKRLIHYIRCAYSDKRRKKVAKWVRSDITEEWLIQQYEYQGGLCAWFKIPLETEMDFGLHQISLDRIDTSRGYVRDNVLLVCRAANFARNDTPPEEFEIFIDYLTASLKRRM